MRFTVIFLAALLVCFTGCSNESRVSPPPTAHHQKNNMITPEALEEMFANMRNAQWDVDGELLWGYFFTDPDPRKLERVVEPLTNAGFKFVSIYETDDRSTHFLHVERVEKHTPQTLKARNDEFYKLAEEFDLESYDGMDVGPVLVK